MKNKFLKSKLLKILIIIMILSLVLTSCSSKSESSENKKTDKDKVDDINAIQLWYYDYIEDYTYSEIVYNISVKIKAYCKLNNIPLKVVRYDKKKLSYDDYVLKRNTAMATGNVIVIDDARKLADVAKQHYDYTKIERYNDLFDLYKNRYCIPLGVGYTTKSIYDELFVYYGVEPSKDIITYEEYLDLKKATKDKGAKFTFSATEWDEITDHNLIKNDLYMLGERSEVIKDENNFREATKNAIRGIYNDYMKYYNSYSDIEAIDKEVVRNLMYDLNSKINLFADSSRQRYLTEYWSYYPGDKNRIHILMPDYTRVSPCIYINKNITDERVLDIVNDTLRLSYYKTFVFDYQDGFVQPAPWYSPTSNTADMRKYAEVNADWQYNGILMNFVNRGNTVYDEMIDRVNQAYELLYKSGEVSEKNADYYFSNVDYNNLVKKSVQDLARKLIEDKLDYNDEKVEKMIDKKVNEVIMNFYVHFD